MPIKQKKKKVPCVLFPYNRPDTFAQVVSALKTQNVDHILVFVDGPKDDKAVRLVDECKRIVKGIDWAGIDYVFKDKNEGPDGFLNNISTVFQSYASAVFLEEDCLPMPSFYSVMKKALRYYKEDERVFSIGSYQLIRNRYFESYPYSFVSSLRFTCWGCAMWRDRWNLISPFFYENPADLRQCMNIPDIAGDDLASFARSVSMNGKRSWEALSWDTKIAILALHFKKVHLLTAKGLVKNIGLDTGIHGGSDRTNHMIHNRNLYDKKAMDIAWLKDTKPDDEYNIRLKTSVDSINNHFLKKAASGTLGMTPITLAAIIARVHAILTQIRTDPIRTMKKIFLRVAGRHLNSFIDIQRKRKVIEYNEYFIGKKNTKSKKALLSYLVRPVLCSPEKRDRAMFSNLGIAQYIPRALNELGYSVDIVDHDNRQPNVGRKYDLFVGHAGMNFESICRQLAPDTLSIYFSTGTYWEFFNKQERERFEYLNERHSIVLPYDRYIYNSEEFANRHADGIICLGNDFVKETYSKFPLVIAVNNAAFPDDKYRYDEKNFEQGRKNFLFYSGSGNVHKGLDLLLDVFQKTKNHLYIVTIIEPIFEKAFYKELHDVPNIHLVGDIHLHDSITYPILNRCNFVIHPSCSEGQPGSVIECMHKGLIPIVSREAGIDTDDFGIMLDNCSIEEILRVVQEVSRKSPEWYRERSIRTRNNALQYYTKERFLQSMKDAIEYIVGQKRKLNER